MERDKTAKLTKETLEEIRSSGTHRIKVAITDVDGILRGKYLQADKFFSAAEGGFGFCNVVFGWDSSDACYDNASYTGWHTGYPDALARIDLNTFRRVPWDAQVPFFLADFEGTDGKALEVCPRGLLKKVIARAERAGLRASVGMEFEWFNFRETPGSVREKNFTGLDALTPGMFGYSLLRMNQNREFLTALFEELQALGVPLEGLHTETGPGVLEACIQHAPALEAADRAVLFKSATKEIASRFGILPSFMAKWNTSLPGCSGHTHQSLWSLNGEKNLFFDEKDPLKMSTTFRHYLAGQLYCLPELLPFFAPTVNSYKRLVDGYWAPTHASWGVDNRTVGFRVIPGSAKSTRVETRVPGADVNPYLAIAASLASGLYGVENRLPLRQEPIQGSAYHTPGLERLPRTLQEATLRLSESRVARDLFGDAFVEHFVKTRLWEWRQFLDSVTNWELQRYFEII